MKVGILSFAHLHAESYVGNIRNSPGVELLGIADEDRERGERFARQFGARFFPSYQALLAEKPDGVIVTSENARHRPLVELAARAGVNILCEKPLATGVADARAMIDTAKAAGVILMTAFPMRFSTPLIEVKGQLDAGSLGRPVCFNASNQGELPKKGRDWFVDPTLAGGGAITDHVVHLADVLRWYLGRDAVEVYARSNRIFHAGEVAVETGGMVMITFDGGVFATIDCSWSRPDYWPGWGGLGFDMVTDRGAVRVDAFRQNLTMYADTTRRPSWLFWGSDANQAMVDEFAAAIRERRAPAVTGEDGLKAVEIVSAAYESVRTGQPVRL